MFENPEVVLVTISDDRSGRKNGLYAQTQDKIERLFKKQDNGFGITKFHSWKWADIQASSFYKLHQEQLDCVDAAVNGRVYKPFVIMETLKHLKDGDFLIYTDCSPELWPMDEDWVISKNDFSIKIITNLCSKNRGILTAYQPWVPDEKLEDRGYHTHENFTFEQSMARMGLTQFKYCLQHASGMVVLQKNTMSMRFVEDWLHWNCIAECAGVQPFNESKNCVFWIKELELYGKIGHRHDQSISGLLLNALSHSLIKSPCLDLDKFHPLTFLQFCRNHYNYRFVSSIKGPTLYKVRNNSEGKISVMLRNEVS